MNPERLLIRAQLDLPWNQVSFTIHHEPKDDGLICYAENLMMNTVQQGTVIKPVVGLQLADAQVLMDDLWNAGLRPTNHKLSDVAFESQGKHLEDMRKIVSTQLGISL